MNKNSTNVNPKLLFVSNGVGEDHIAVKIISRLQSTSKKFCQIEAWPMVGRGEAYQQAGITSIGPSNLLPSCGFATLSLRWMLKDLRSGWLSTHWRQIQFARGIRRQYSLVVAVGDVVPILAAVLSKVPFIFVGCAKSSYYSPPHGYTRLEKYLLRRLSLLVYPRDRLTAGELQGANIPHNYVGNPMMDDLETAGIDFPVPKEQPVVALLPGSRYDSLDNALDLLRMISPAPDGPEPVLTFIYAVTDSFPVKGFRERRMEDDATLAWIEQTIEERDRDCGIVLRYSHPSGHTALLTKGAFADVIRRSTLVVGLAGTANEQAVGMGKPLLTFPSRGIMGSRYVRMKMQFFGPSAVRIPVQPGALKKAIYSLLDDPERRRMMAVAGCERMGSPGASRLIAAGIRRQLENETVRVWKANG